MVGFKCQDPKCQLSLICKQFGPYLQRGVQPTGNQRRCLQNGNDQFSGPVEQIFKWRGGGGGGANANVLSMSKLEGSGGMLSREISNLSLLKWR